MTAWGNISSIFPDKAQRDTTYDVDVYGGPFPPGSGSGWQWRLGAYVYPYTVIDSGHLKLHVKAETGPQWVGPTTVMNERQQPGDTLGAADFLITDYAGGVPPEVITSHGPSLWRLTLHERAFVPTVNPTTDLFIAEIWNARSIHLEQKLNDSAILSFTVEGHSPAAQLIKELETDVMAWRFDEQSGLDIPLFRGIVAQSQDTLSEQTDTVTFTCHDYLDMLKRRILTSKQNFAQVDQDTIAANLIDWGAKQVKTSGNVNLAPGCYLPLHVVTVDPAGAARGLSGSRRDRQYAAQQDVSEAFANLAAVEGGFDFDVIPGMQASPPTSDDQVRVFFPYQGTLRDYEVILEYGSTVRALSRSVNSGDYANYVRNLGNNGQSDPNAVQLYAEATDPSSNNVTQDAQGLWMAGFNDSDVSVQATLQQHANGYLKSAAVLEPSYSLTLRPNAYSWGKPRMGDICRLIIKAGRLDVDITLRVVGISFVVGEDGGEEIGLTVGRSSVTFADLTTAASRDIDALARR
jgi:hypothetical protein